jgi:hypothetical protein
MTGSSAERKYLMTSDELLAPDVGAVAVGHLASGAFEAVNEEMRRQAEQRGVNDPKLIANLIFRQEMEAVYGSTGHPYPIAEFEWEAFAADVPEYCGDNVPVVYMVDGSRYTAPI